MAAGLRRARLTRGPGWGAGAVARQAQADGVATASHDNLIQAVQDAMWQPVYGNLEA